MDLSVHLLRASHPKSRAVLQERLLETVRASWGTEMPAPANFEILVAGRPDRDHVTASPRLRALIIPFAGVPEKTGQLLRDYPHITVHNLHHNARPVGELAMSLLLAAAKSVLPMDRAMRDGNWLPRYESHRALMLHGKTALVLGYGAIGQEVGQLCQALGMHVIATRRRSGRSPTQLGVKLADSSVDTLRRLLPRADVLLVCLPHTPETDGLIGTKELSLLPPWAILINVGRGPIVQEGPLYKALVDGSIRVAGLDVWYNYPEDEAARSSTQPSASPFHELGNVVMSPHRGGLCVETEGLRMAALADLLNAGARGDPLPNRVDLTVGY